MVTGSGGGNGGIGINLAPAARIARWAPPGMAARAIADAAAGRYGAAAAELCAGLLVVALAIWVWIWALRRVLERADVSTAVRPDQRASVARPAAAPRSRWAGRAWTSRTLAAAGRELRYYRRDPRRRQQLVNLVMPVLLIVVNSSVALGAHAAHGPVAVGLAAPGSALPSWPAVLGGVFAGLFSAANQFGLEGSPLWMNVVATARWQDLRADIAGKQLAGAAVTVPIFAALYAVLVESTPSPVVELNRAVAVSMAFGPAAGLLLVDALNAEPSLAGYHLLPSVRGDLLAKLGRRDEARAEFERAAALTRNVRERTLLLERAAACAAPPAERS